MQISHVIFTGPKHPKGLGGLTPYPSHTQMHTHTHTAHTSQTHESLKVFPSWATSVSVKIS